MKIIHSEVMELEPGDLILVEETQRIAVVVKVFEQCLLVEYIPQKGSGYSFFLYKGIDPFSYIPNYKEALEISIKNNIGAYWEKHKQNEQLNALLDQLIKNLSFNRKNKKIINDTIKFFGK